MKTYFVCSLCHNGVLGGGLVVDDESLTYRTNKLTVDKKYRNLRLEVKDIEGLSWKWVVFPVATFTMKDGSSYKFLIFNKWRFNKVFEQIKKN